jgi:hypothetical protein
MVRMAKGQVWQRVCDFFPITGLHFSRPIVLFQSDDWGFLGIRDRDGFDELQGHGFSLGSQPYDFCSLETAEDLHRLYEVLRQHHDSVGRSPCFVFNFILANVDFSKVIESNFRRLELMPLDEGLPGSWKRPGLLRAYREGIENGLIYPGFHGLTHFSQNAVEGIMRGHDERNRLLRVLYEAQTPMINDRTPWIDFEYRKLSDGRTRGWLDGPTQRKLMGDGKKIFQRMFGVAPVSACAPGYRANEDTRRAWMEEGILVGQNGPSSLLAPHFDGRGLLHLYRNVPFEPALDPDRYDERDAMNRAEEAINAGKPVIVCMHSVNFHSALKNYRDVTLEHLHRFLTMLERKYDDLLYVHDSDILSMVQKNGLEWKGQKLKIEVSRHFQRSPTLGYYWTKVTHTSGSLS